MLAIGTSAGGSEMAEARARRGRELDGEAVVIDKAVRRLDRMAQAAE
jgi:hypothetical protein